MQIFIRLYTSLIVYSALGFRKGFFKFLLGGFVLMDCLKHLTLDYELGCGFFLFGSLKRVYKILGLFLLLRFGFKFFSSDWFSKVSVRFLCEEPGKMRYGFCSKNVVDGKFRLLKLSKVEPLIDKMEEEREKVNCYSGSDGTLNTDSDEEYFTDNNEDECTEEDDVSKLLKMERLKVGAACAELERERAAAASAAEESMAMILRLQNEKSVIEMEWSQFRRLAEEKQIHDQQVIRCLQWLVWQHESEEQLKPCRPKLKKEEDESCFSGNILDALENVLYSSLDANNL